MSRIRSYFLLIVGLALGVAGFYSYEKYQTSQNKEPEYHVHANFAVFLNGQRFDFAKLDYMSIAPCTTLENSLIPVAQAHGADFSIEENPKLGNVHLHDMNGGVIHIHAKGITYADFFASLHMTLTNNAFIDENGEEYIATDKFGEMTFMLNGEKITDLPMREINDLDRAMISFGVKNRSESQFTAEYGQVPDDACISSNKCPERGTAGEESCVSGSVL
jgi:hypothetical protein